MHPVFSLPHFLLIHMPDALSHFWFHCNEEQDGFLKFSFSSMLQSGNTRNLFPFNFFCNLIYTHFFWKQLLQYSGLQDRCQSINYPINTLNKIKLATWISSNFMWEIEGFHYGIRGAFVGQCMINTRKFLRGNTSSLLFFSFFFLSTNICQWFLKTWLCSHAVLLYSSTGCPAQRSHYFLLYLQIWRWRIFRFATASQTLRFLSLILN